jgi:hypothetical protein
MAFHPICRAIAGQPAKGHKRQGGSRPTANRLPVAESLWHVTPRSDGLGNPQDEIDQEMVLPGGNARARAFRAEGPRFTASILPG